MQNRMSTRGIQVNGYQAQAQIKRQRRSHKTQADHTGKSGLRRYTKAQKEREYQPAPVFRPRG